MTRPLDSWRSNDDVGGDLLHPAGNYRKLYTHQLQITFKIQQKLAENRYILASESPGNNPGASRIPHKNSRFFQGGCSTDQTLSGEHGTLQIMSDPDERWGWGPPTADPLWGAQHTAKNDWGT